MLDSDPKVQQTGQHLKIEIASVSGSISEAQTDHGSYEINSRYGTSADFIESAEVEITPSPEPLKTVVISNFSSQINSRRKKIFNYLSFSRRK